MISQAKWDLFIYYLYLLNNHHEGKRWHYELIEQRSARDRH